MMSSSRSLNVSTSFEEETSKLQAAVVVTPDGCADEMLDTVDHCVACVNQIDLQHEFEQQAPELRMDTGTSLHDLVLEQWCAPGADACREAAADESIEVTAEELERNYQCDVCRTFDHSLASLPCCNEGTVCTSCLGSLTFAARDGCRAGRCPCCRSWILFSSQNDISMLAAVSAGRCDSCDKKTEILIPLNQMNACDGCFLGMRCPLLYECRSCSSRQIIPRALYRSQKSVHTFGTEEAPCNACGEDSTWRLVANQTPPMGDSPWGEGNTLSEAHRRVSGHPEKDSGCYIQ